MTELTNENQEILDNLRKEIDGVDEEIVMALVRRFALTEEVGEFKAKNSLEALDETREAKQFKKIKKMSEEFGVDKELLVDLFTLIFNAVKKRHREIAS